RYWQGGGGWIGPGSTSSSHRRKPSAPAEHKGRSGQQAGMPSIPTTHGCHGSKYPSRRDVQEFGTRGVKGGAVGPLRRVIGDATWRRAPKALLTPEVNT